MPILLQKCSWLRKFAKSYLSPALRLCFSNEPAAQVIRQTARGQKRLLATNMGCSLMVALSEGATLGVVFVAVEVLTAPEAQAFNWADVQILACLGWHRLSALPTGGAFVLLLAVAVLLQALQSLASFANSVSVGYFIACCTTMVKSHAQPGSSVQLPLCQWLQDWGPSQLCGVALWRCKYNQGYQQSVGECAFGTYLYRGADEYFSLIAGGGGGHWWCDQFVATSGPAADC